MCVFDSLFDERDELVVESAGAKCSHGFAIFHKVQINVVHELFVHNKPISGPVTNHLLRVALKLRVLEYFTVLNCLAIHVVAVTV